MKTASLHNFLPSLHLTVSFHTALEFVLCIHLSPKFLLNPLSFVSHLLFFSPQLNFISLPLLSLEMFLMAFHSNFCLTLYELLFKFKDSKM